MRLDFDNVFGSQPVDFKCPGCGHKFSVVFQELLVDGGSIECPGCKRSIQIEHDSSVAEAVESVNASFKELERAFNNLGK